MASIVADEDVFMQFKEESTWHSWYRLDLLEGRPEFDSRFGTTGRSVPLSLQVMRRWREASANVLYEYDCMIVCMLENMKNKQKEWHSATKPF